MDSKPEDGSLSWQEQRQEAIRRQQDRWRQLHPQQQQEHPVQPQQQQQQQQNPAYPPIPPAHAAGPLLHYPDIPAPSAPPLDSAAEHASAADADRQRRQQQEEEDHRLAMQLQEQFAAEDEAPAGTGGQHQGLQDTPMAWEGLESGDEDDWEAIARTASMGQTGTGQGQGPMGQHAAAASARPTTQAAAAAGSNAGSVIGAGLSALLAMAAQAAANRAQQAAAGGGGGDAAGVGEPRTSQGISAAAAGQHGAGSSAAAQHTAAAAAGTGAAAGGGGGGGSSGSGGDVGVGVLNMAANALRSFLASRAAANPAGSSAAAAAGSTGHQNEEERRWEDEQPAPEDLEMLQNMLQSLMGGTLPPGLGANRNQPPGAAPAAAAGAQAGSTGGPRGGASSGSGFRMTRLPGGGFSATYSSSSGPGSSSSWQVHSSTSHSGGTGDPFGGMMGGGGDMDPMVGGPDDFLSQLLLAGARSARDTPGRTGYTHYDPRSGDAQFEPMGGAAGAAGMGLEALLSQLMGPGLFGGGAGGPMSYEDLVGLSDVQVTTPEEVLSSLPQSKYVEGRKPGDSDTCVICQTVYSAGDDLTHLPCLHAFHKDCISPWLSGHSRKCPVCKTDVC